MIKIGALILLSIFLIGARHSFVFCYPVQIGTEWGADPSYFVTNNNFIICQHEWFPSEELVEDSFFVKEIRLDLEEYLEEIQGDKND